MKVYVYDWCDPEVGRVQLHKNTQSAGDIFHFVNIRGIATKLGEVVPV